MNLQSAIKKIITSSLFAVLCGLFVLSVSVAAQNENQPQVRIRGAEDKNDPETNSIQEMVVKQQISRRKKEYDEMLKQGDDALKLSQDLETAFESKERLSNEDLQKLQDLEKVVSKIREELGGNDDDDRDDVSANSDENEARKSAPAAFKFLRETTIKLVDELKKSTRFSISVAAIQASNSVIKFARFLRLKK